MAYGETKKTVSNSEIKPEVMHSSNYVSQPKQKKNTKSKARRVSVGKPPVYRCVDRRSLSKTNLVNRDSKKSVVAAIRRNQIRAKNRPNIDFEGVIDE